MKKFIFIIIAMFALAGCNEENFLNEKPLDFMSAANSYETTADFDAAVTELYYLVRLEFFGDVNRNWDYIKYADMMMTSDGKANLAADLNPSSDVAKGHWDRLYKIVAQANVIVSRVNKSATLTEAQKEVYMAKALFFRGFAYRTLAYLYGGVKLQLEEVTSPRTDFTRATREATINQAIEDVKYGTTRLPGVTEVKDGEITDAAAYFLLAELYLAAGNNTEAINAATTVINNPALGLMTERFGSRMNEDGDVYWDLFRRDNQNRSSGNTEGIWVIQEEVDVPGGGSSTSDFFWYTSSYWLERICAPQTGLFRFILPDGTSVAPFVWPTGDYTGGRGIASLFANKHFYHEVWESDFDNDIRNSEYNWPRKFKFNDPNFIAKYGDMFGTEIDLENPNLPAGVKIETGYDNGVLPPDALPNRFLCGYQTKCTTPFNHPDAQYLNKDTYLISGTGGKTVQDQYMFRLAEAYLLRAEAYLKDQQADKAAADINVVRARAKAKPCTASEVDMDYILDERLREFGIEEKRLLTLQRTGTMYDRIMAHNEYYNLAKNSATGEVFQQKYTLLPIPLSAIEANKDAVLEQNPGY